MSGSMYRGAGEAEDYCRSRRRSEVDDAVIELLPGEGRVLEVGCGPGMLLQGAGRILLVETDRSRHMLAIARCRGAGCGVFACCDAAHLPFMDGVFRTVTAMAVLHHLDDSSLGSALLDLARVTRQGGTILIAEDWAFEDPDEFEAWARRLRFSSVGDCEYHRTAGDWNDRVEAAGFSVRKILWPRRPFDPASTRAGAGGCGTCPAGPGTVRMLVLEAERL